MISIRCTALTDEIRRAQTLAYIASLNPANRGYHLDPFYLHAEELQRASDRLQSAIERALGTRGRHYDG